ncbi:MAG: 6-carboxytetrahydropterin synthase [Nitrospirota bacterium]|nr:6-carboxytetrahydropterin synthase [Nitrospirota bacterium]
MSAVYLTKRAEVAVAHQCLRDDWNALQNEAVYGLESRPHGHNYLIEVTVAGEVRPESGMVVNIKDVKAAMGAVLADYDHRNLNGDHPAFARQAPTTERVVQQMWADLQGRLTDGTLERVRLFENEDTWYEAHRPGSPLAPGVKASMLITRRYTFSAAHRLHAPSLSEQENRDLFRDCNNPNGHGHNYTLEVTVGGDVDPQTGLATDHRGLDETIRKAVVDRYNFRNLNGEVPEFADQVTTSENIVRTIWQTLERQLGDGTLYRIRLGETRDNYFEYYG